MGICLGRVGLELMLTRWGDFLAIYDGWYVERQFSFEGFDRVSEPLSFGGSFSIGKLLAHQSRAQDWRVATRLTLGSFLMSGIRNEAKVANDARERDVKTRLEDVSVVAEYRGAPRLIDMTAMMRDNVENW